MGVMERLQAFKFELQPNGEQAQQMRRFAGSCRLVFNKALALQQTRHEQGEKKLSYAGLCKALTEWKAQPETLWLKETHSQPLQQTLKDLERAYVNFFEQRANFPRFKKKGMGDSFRYPQGCKLDQGNGRIFLPKLGWLRYRHSRDVLGDICNVTISQSGGKWFASIQTRREVVPEQPTGGIVGLDMGIARFVTLSDGSHLDPLNSFKKHQQRLKRYQRRLARKVKFSQNWKKAKAKVSQIHIDLGNARKDYLHQASAAISQNHAIVCIEDLQIRNMSKSSKGNAETHGKQVKQKSGLNRAILDQGWGEFRRQLDYKLAWRGGHLIAVPPHNTSRTCPACGHISKENRRSQAQFACVACGYQNHADVVGAINVLEAVYDLRDSGDPALKCPEKYSLTSCQLRFFGSFRLG